MRPERLIECSGIRNGVLQKRWIYRDSLRPAAELDAAGNVVSRFVYAYGAGAATTPQYVVRAGQTLRVVADQLGSVRLLVDATSGAVVERVERDEFGVVLSDTAPGTVPFGFAGGFYDPDTGLVKFGVREYDARSGRWMSRDPILFGGGQANLYAYVGNDPINRTDPSGLRDWSDAEVRDLLSAYAARLDQSHLPLLLMANQHRANEQDDGTGGDFDFWGRQITTDDTFELCGVGKMTSAQFGNFIAGYGAGAIDSPLAYWLVRAAGSYYGVDAARNGIAPSGPWENLGDSAESVFFIDLGTNFGLRASGNY